MGSWLKKQQRYDLSDSLRSDWSNFASILLHDTSQHLFDAAESNAVELGLVVVEQFLDWCNST